MSIYTAQADAFFTEIQKHQLVWTVRDEAGYPSPVNSEGKRAMPFWSLESRAQKVVENIEAYQDFKVISLSLDEWKTKWLPGLEKDELLVGPNWSGTHATGFDLTPKEALNRLNAAQG